MEGDKKKGKKGQNGQKASGPGPSKRKASRKSTPGKKQKNDLESYLLPRREYPSVSKAFDIDVIFNHIFGYVTFRSLLSCSLVNKNWNARIRAFIEDERICVPRFYSSCSSLKDLENAIDGAEVPIPLNGLALVPHCGTYGKCRNCEDPVRETLVEKLNLRYLEIRKPGCYLSREPYGEEQMKVIEECATFRFMKEILLKKAGNITRLVISDYISSDPAVSKLFQRDGQDPGWLRSLRSFRLATEPKHVSAAFVQQIAAAAPNLKSVEGFVPPSCLSSLSPASRNSLKELFVSADPALAEAYCGVGGNSLRTVIMPHYWDWHEESMQPLVSAIRGLFGRISDTLVELNVDESVLVMMMKLDFPSLKKVRRMRVRYERDFNRETGCKLLRSIDLEKLFPMLDELEVYANEEFDYNPKRPFLKELLQGPTQSFLSFSVTKLHLKSDGCYGWDLDTFEGVAGMFPNVKQFFGYYCEKEVKVAIYSTWPELEYLDYCTSDWLGATATQDHVYCGITEKEAKRLHNRGIRFLKAYDDFEPDGPSIRDLKNLKKLRLRIRHPDGCKRPFKSDRVFLTKVTGELCFSRMPNLKVEIMRCDCDSFIFSPQSCNYNLMHLKSFVQFIDEEPDDQMKKDFWFHNYLPKELQVNP